MGLKSCFLVLLAIISVRIENASSDRVLTLFLIAGRSNMEYFDPIHLELAKKGHSVTVITPTPGLVKYPNIMEYQGLDFKALVGGMSNRESHFQRRLAGERMGRPFHTMAESFSNDCRLFHELPIVQKLIAGDLGKFDLVMTMAFMNECVYGIISHLNTTSVIISTVSATPWFAGVTGAPTPLSFVPHTYYEGSQEMTFLERAQNLVTFTYQMVTRKFIFLPEIEKSYRTFIPNADSVDKVLSNVSLILGAGHQSFGPLRPTMPDLVDSIGGIQCRPGKPLPKEIQEMIQDRKGVPQDFVYFSLGSIVQGHEMPDKIRLAIINTFAKFPDYKFLWKWEVESNEKLPENVRVSKWFPQQDVLAHEKCKLFITHGGLSSLHESIYHNVPLIGVPFFGDQDWNMKQVEYHGIGRKLELGEITEEKLTSLVKEVLHNPKYRDTMNRHSVLFRDRQVSALDLAMWNIEYVMRHQGAVHLRSPSRQMSILQYYSIDVIFVIYFCTLLILLVILMIASKALRYLFPGKNIIKVKSKRN